MKKKGVVLWYTGIAASGKSSISKGVVRVLRDRGIDVEDLDADEVRSHISPNLGWSIEARDENTKRLAFFGAMLAKHGVWASISAVSSLRRFRDRARSMTEHFVEIFCKCPIEVARQRDPKGLYKRADEGKVNDIAGLHQPFEDPLKPEVLLETDKLSIEESVQKVVGTLERLGHLAPTGPRKADEGVDAGYSAEDEEKIKKRLADLGYL